MQDLETATLKVSFFIILFLLASFQFFYVIYICFGDQISDFLQNLTDFFSGYTVPKKLEEDKKVKLSYSAVATLLQNDSPFLEISKISTLKVTQGIEYKNAILLYNNKKYRVVELSLVDYIKFMRLKKRLDKQKANLATKKEKIEALRFAKEVMEKENKRIAELSNKEKEKCKAEQKQASIDISEYAKNAKNIAEKDIKLTLSSE